MRGNERKKSWEILGLVFAIAILSAGFVWIAVFLIGEGAKEENFSADWERKEDSGVPRPEEYYLSESARCSLIREYEYNEEGLPVKISGYRYSAHDKPVWFRDEEILYYYDEKGRLRKELRNNIMVYQEEPYSVYETEYKYNADGSYSVYSYHWGDQQTYDEDGNILSDRNRWNRDIDLYYEYENGALSSIKTAAVGDDRDLAVQRGSVSYYDSTDRQEISHASLLSWKPYKVYNIWLDYYDEAGNITATCWTQSKEDLVSSRPLAELEDLLKPGYYAFYDGERLIEEISCERDRDLLEHYIDEHYSFYDYDDKGNRTWYYYVPFPNVSHFGATRFIYEEGRLVREVHYRIDGEWRHTLYDGTTIELKYSGENLTDIFRYDEHGNIMHNYVVRSNEKGHFQLMYTIGADGEITAEWQKTLKEYRERYGDNGDFGAFDYREGSDGRKIYPVQRGDCLWHIAEKLYGSGARWRELYERNRRTIGEYPSRIYEGMELLY